MTEDQAKLTRCCGPEGCGIRRREDLERVRRERGQHNTDAELFAALQLAPRYCIGSACMGWRWNGAFLLPNDPFPISDRYDGRCGLAGPP